VPRTRYRPDMAAPRTPLRSVVLAGLLVALGWAGAPDDPDVPAAASPEAPAATPTVTEAPEAVPTDEPTPAASPAEETSGLFHGTVPDVEGGEIDLSAFAGRDVAVWFWAPW
jgi:hypothetical protein